MAKKSPPQAVKATQTPPAVPVITNAKQLQELVQVVNVAAAQKRHDSLSIIRNAIQVVNASSVTRNFGNGSPALARQDIFRFLLDGPRDIDAECGYPAILTTDHYTAMYDREGVSRRVVECYPEETWSMDPEVYETEDEGEDEETKFETAWKALVKKFNVWYYLFRADVLSRIGQFGVLLIGIDDGQELSTPIDGVNDDGTYDKGLEYGLLYIRPFSEESLWVKTRETDMGNPRYGLPTMYTIHFRDYPNWGVQAGEIIAKDVHWSRVIHLADHRKTSEVYGQPAMSFVYNRLYDIRKVLASSGEGYWKSAFPGIAFEVNPELADQGITIDEDSIRTEMANFQNSLQRYIAITGVTAKTLAPVTSDPTPFVMTYLKIIATVIGIPYRVLFGSEEAKLAGDKDSDNWNKKLARRQNKYVTPMIIRPFVDRLVGLGILPAPETGEYNVDWPDLNTPSDGDKAAVALQKTQALGAYITGGISQLMPPDLYLTLIMGFTSEEATAILQGAADSNAEQTDDEDDPEEGDENEGSLGGAEQDQADSLNEEDEAGDTTIPRGGKAVGAELVQQPNLNMWSDAARKASALARATHKPASHEDVKEWIHDWSFGSKATDENHKRLTKSLTPDKLVAMGEHRPDEPMMLYRAHIEGRDSSPIESWTTEREAASIMADKEFEDGRSGGHHRVLIARKVHPSEMVVSVGHTSNDIKNEVGLHHEVIVANGAFARKMAAARGEKLEKGGQWSGKWSSIKPYAKHINEGRVVQNTMNTMGWCVLGLVQQPNLNSDSKKKQKNFHAAVRKVAFAVNRRVAVDAEFPLGPDELCVSVANAYASALDAIPDDDLRARIDAVATFNDAGKMVVPDGITLNEWSEAAREKSIEVREEHAHGKEKKTRTTWHGHSMVGLIRHAALKGLSKKDTGHVLGKLGLTPSPTTIAIQHTAAKKGAAAPVLAPEHAAEFESAVKAHLGYVPDPITPTPPDVADKPKEAADDLATVAPAKPATAKGEAIPPPKVFDPVVSRTVVSTPDGKLHEMKPPEKFSDATHTVVHVDLEKVLSRMKPEDHLPEGGGVGYASERYKALKAHVDAGGAFVMPEAGYEIGHTPKITLGKGTIALMRDKGVATAPFAVPKSDEYKFRKAFEFDPAEHKARMASRAAEAVEAPKLAAKAPGVDPSHFTKVELPYHPPATTKIRAEEAALSGLEKTKHAERKKAAEENLTKLTAAAHMFSRVPRSVVSKILGEGRFKTQFESGRSLGCLSPTMRAKAEYKGLGTPKDIDPKKRPYYGYLHSDPNGGPNSCGAAHYGDVKFKFKTSVRPRATFTIGDSLSGMEMGHLAGAPINKPAVHAAANDFCLSRSSTATKIEDLNYAYTEMQIHGGVSLDDVDSVIVPSAWGATDEFKSLEEKHLKPRGITVIHE